MLNLNYEKESKKENDDEHYVFTVYWNEQK
jgi:hypothetical protein